RIRQRERLKYVDDVLEFGRRCLEKASPRGNVVEEIPHGDGRALAGAARFRRLDGTAVHADERPGDVAHPAGSQLDLCNRGDRGHGLPPKTERSDALEILDAANLAGGV